MNERHEGKHLRRQEAKKRWKTILAVFLSVVLVMQSSNIQAFADVLASGGSEGRDEVVMDPAAEDTGAQGEVTTPEETDTTDEQASSQDDAEQTVAETEENPVETTAQDAEATTPDGQSDQAQSEQAPAEETDTTVTLNVEVSAATLKYSAQDGTEKSVTSETDPKSVDVSNTLDFTFTVAPDDGQKVSSVAYAGAELTANDSGEYTIAAADLTDGEKIVVTTEAVPTEEPAEDAIPVESEEATESTGDEAATAEDASESETPAANNGTSTMAARAVDFTVEVGGTISINGSTDGWIPQHKWSVDSGDGQVRLANIDGQTVRVTGVSEGTVTLKHEYKATAAWNWEEEYFTVQVTPAPTVDITEESLQITLGDEGQLTATATPAGSSVTWSSSDERVATVDQNGLVTTHQTGVATITARNGSASDTATIYVVSPATYRLVYNSNYPSDAKKIVYENGNAGNIKLEDAVETNAVYTYEPGSRATIAGDMTLANYEFLGWSTDPNATEPDSAYDPGAEVTMESNLTLYAVWGNKIEIGNQTTVTVRYYKNQYGNNCVDKQTTAFRSWRNGQATYTFVLGNNQDTIESDSPNLRGWQHDGEYYAFNETITTSEYRAYGHNQIIIEVRPWFDNNATYAQFFVLKADNAAFGNAGSYYSVGTGSINSELFDSGSQNNVYPNGTEDKSNNISELIVSAPSPTQIASILNISLDEAQAVRWYVAKNQDDGYHVDGVIYRAGVYHNVRFIDTATGDVMASYVVEDMGTVYENQIPDTSSLEDFECWVDESGKRLESGDINLIGDDLTFYTKYVNKYNITASIVDNEGAPVEGAIVSPSTQSVKQGEQSEAISFDIPDGYKIEKITVNSQDQTGDNAGKTEYAYPAQTVNGDITIVVQVARTYKVSYSWSGLKGSNPWADGEGVEHKATLPNDGAAYEVTAGETFEVDKTYAAGATFQNEYGTWTFSGWSTGDFEVTGDKEITGTWTLTHIDISGPEVTVNSPQDVPYNGTNQTWVPTVTDGNKVLVAGTDYEVSYSTDDHTNVTGTIRVTITGKGNYTGSVERYYQITPLTITVTPRDIRKTQGQADPTLTSDYSGYLRGETAGWTGALTREPGEAVGTYTISRGSLQLADNPAGNFLAQNYILVVNEGTFTIVAAPVTPGGGDTPTPTPGGGGDGTPTPGTPATVTPADDTTTDEAAPEETIADDENALAAPTDTIGDDDTPLAAGAKDEDCWVHWLILLGMILSAVYFVGVGVRRRKFTSSLLGYEDKVLGNDRDNA